jgi:ferrous iron transport protein A
LYESKNLTHLKDGEDAIIKEFTNGYIACKLMAMGLLSGTSVIMVRKSPFGGAYYIKSNDHVIGLRNNEAEHVLLINN